LADESVIDQLQAEDIMRMVQNLPEIYRFTFNLYEIESYSHEEIASIFPQQTLQKFFELNF
jgi:RNA polymerase sigma-70 factor (ECF subfamily)